MIGKEFVDTASTIGIQSLVCDIHYTRENNGSWAAGTRAEKELEAGIADMIATALSQPAEKHAAQTVPAEKAGSKNKRKGEAGGRHAAAVEAAAPPVPDVDHELVMKCYDENMQVSSADLRIAIFDYGGQSVFNVVHHLFLTQFGVYVAVFNMVTALMKYFICCCV